MSRPVDLKHVKKGSNLNVLIILLLLSPCESPFLNHYRIVHFSARIRVFQLSQKFADNI